MFTVVSGHFPRIFGHSEKVTDRSYSGQGLRYSKISVCVCVSVCGCAYVRGYVFVHLVFTLHKRQYMCL